MHFDLAHAIMTGLIAFAVMWIFRTAGWSDGKHFDWRQVAAMTVAVFILNLVWPWPA